MLFASCFLSILGLPTFFSSPLCPLLSAHSLFISILFAKGGKEEEDSLDYLRNNLTKCRLPWYRPAREDVRRSALPWLGRVARDSRPVALHARDRSETTPAPDGGSVEILLELPPDADGESSSSDQGGTRLNLRVLQRSRVPCRGPTFLRLSPCTCRFREHTAS